MIKLDIVNRLVERLDMPRLAATKAVNTVFGILKEGLAAGERFELRGFGVFQVKARKTGIGRNPKTGQAAAIPPGKTVRFKAGKDILSPPVSAGGPVSAPWIHLAEYTERK